MNIEQAIAVNRLNQKIHKCQFRARFGVLKTKNEILEGECQMLVPLFGQSSRTKWTGNVSAWKSESNVT